MIELPPYTDADLEKWTAIMQLAVKYIDDRDTFKKELLASYPDFDLDKKGGDRLVDFILLQAEKEKIKAEWDAWNAYVLRVLEKSND